MASRLPFDLEVVHSLGLVLEPLMVGYTEQRLVHGLKRRHIFQLPFHIHQLEGGVPAVLLISMTMTS